MTVTRLKRRRKRVRLRQTQRVKKYKKSVFRPANKKVDVEKIEASFLNK